MIQVQALRKFSVLVFLLTGCGSTVTRENALYDCPTFYNVQCQKINNKPDYEIIYVGREVKRICGGHVLGCIKDKVIYQYEKDWLVTAHERCHNYCSYQHIKTKREIKIPYIK